jgi:hypothetical protein
MFTRVLEISVYIIISVFFLCIKKSEIRGTIQKIIKPVILTKVGINRSGIKINVESKILKLLPTVKVFLFLCLLIHFKIHIYKSA